jgi:hypothetical protein
MERTLGFDKYDEINWYETQYPFTCTETNKIFYTAQYNYNTLNKTKISDYDYDVSKAYASLKKTADVKINRWYFF